MAHVDPARRDLLLTLLLAGPVRAGKQSVLAAIRDRVPPARRAGGTSIAPGLLAWLPLELGLVGGWQVRLRLYALPEESAHQATRHLLLAQADGLLLVLDGQAARLEDNLAALRRLEDDRTDRDGGRRDLATVVLYTKQDLPPELLLPRPGLEAALNRAGAPSWGGDVPQGTGVLEALHALVTLALRRHAPPMVGP
jgi:signal recognition particle receptor subunit beta